MEHTTSLRDRLGIAAASWADTHPGLAALLTEAAEMDAALTTCLSALADLRRALGDDGSRRLGALVHHAAQVSEDAERYRWLAQHARATSEHWGGRWSLVIDGPAPVREDC